MHINVEGTTGHCVKSKLGTWLAEVGGGFHPSLVFRNDPEDTSIETRNMGMSIFTEQAINQHGVLASCSIRAILGRKNSLEAIEKLLQFTLSKGKNSSENHLLDSDPHLLKIKILPGLTCNWLDRTVISLYLILTRLSISLRDLKCVENSDKLNLAPLSPSDHAIIELFSFHEEYVRLLPCTEDMMTPLFWNKCEIEKLSSTLLHHSVIEQEQLWKKEYETLMKNIFEVSPILHGFLGLHICCDDYFWACTIVTSRSFPSALLATSSNIHQGPNLEDRLVYKQKLDSQPILLPGVDIFNHRRGAQVEWRSINFDSQVQRIELVTLEDQLAPGHQVFNNYGPKSTGELIMGYGFALSEEDWKNHHQPEDVMVNNPDDIYTIKLSKPKIQSVDSPLSSKFFDGFKEEDLIHHIRRDGLIPPALLAQLRMLVISTQEEVNQLDLLYPPLTQIGLDSLKFQKLNWFNELNTLDCLISMIDLKLKDLNEFNHASDGPFQWDQVRTPIKKMIQIYRQGQHDILESALEHLDTTFNLTLDEAGRDGFQYELCDDLEKDSDDLN